MRVSIFGMGYVGCTLSACLASDGHVILGVEPNELRAAAIRTGRLPFEDPGGELGSLFYKHHSNISVEIVDPATAVVMSDITFICVGTPRRNDDAGFDLRQLRCAAEQVGEGLGRKVGYHTVVVKSTVMPGTTRKVIKPILEVHSGKKADTDFGLLFNPEFLREASAVKDFYAPPFTVVGGSLSAASPGGPASPAVRGAASRAALKELYDWVRAPWVETDFETAEMLKLACNAFHALKVCFANEIGNLCRAEDIDGQRVMELLVQDHKLNLSPAYLKPGSAFGGHCLSKDVGALNDLAEASDLATPLLKAILPSNDDQIELARLARRQRVSG